MDHNDETNNIYFPLCCLNYNRDISVTANNLISYGIIEFGSKLENEIELNNNDYNNIENYIDEHNISEVQSDTDNFIILSAIKLNINIGSLHGCRKRHSEIKSYVRSFEFKHKTDALVKVHKDLLFDVRDKQFDERMFRVYCAVISVIGDKPFIRITNKRISYRMLGYKSEEVYNKEKSKMKSLTARQIKTTIDKLTERNFFEFRTYRKRITYYSTRFRGKEFDEVLTNSIAVNKAKKEVNKINMLIPSEI